MHSIVFILFLLQLNDLFFCLHADPLEKRLSCVSCKKVEKIRRLNFQIVVMFSQYSRIIRNLEYFVENEK